MENVNFDTVKSAIPPKALIFTSGALSGLLAGCITGFLIGRHKYNKRVKISDIRVYRPADVVTTTETDDVEEDVVEDEGIENVEPSSARNIYIVESIPDDYVNETPVEPEYDDAPAPEVIDIFAKTGSQWDFEAELANRRTNMPYVIHADEFMENEGNRRQSTVTYYAGDDVMVDELDTPIYNHTSLMGELKFGHGSNDANVVYIRNEQAHMEWEVLKHTGHYSIEVLGLDDETDDKPGLRRFRDD